MDLFAKLENEINHAGSPENNIFKGGYKEKSVQPDSTNATQFHSTTARLKFLGPCSSCGGRKYHYNRANGKFHCAICWPQSKGLQPMVLATGNNSRPGATFAIQGDLICGNQYPMDKDLQEARKCFERGFKFVVSNLDELLQSGWTRPELFRRSRNKWPVGNWGLAWLGVWKQPEIQIEIESTGKVRFSFKSGARTVNQSAYPWKLCRKNGVH